jgi:hypothetical protein
MLNIFWSLSLHCKTSEEFEGSETFLSNFAELGHQVGFRAFMNESLSEVQT